MRRARRQTIRHVKAFSVHVVLATGHRPIRTDDALVSSNLPNTRTLADEMSAADPTPVRSNRRYVSRV